jgi:hypothetical protein
MTKFFKALFVRATMRLLMKSSNAYSSAMPNNHRPASKLTWAGPMVSK